MGTRKVGICGSPCGAIAAVILLLLSVSAKGAPVVFTGSSSTHSASVSFEQIGNTLQITLANTSAEDVMKPSDVLSAVFFSLAGDPKLTRTSAAICSGSTVLFGVTDPAGCVGGEWAYKNHLRGAPSGANEGISSCELGMFGSRDRFPGSNLAGSTGLGGLDFGLTSTHDNPSTGDRPCSGRVPLIQSSATFVLTGLPNDYVLTALSISQVSFQYGESAHSHRSTLPGKLDETADIPEPSTWTLVLGGLGLLSLYSTRRHHRVRHPV